MNNDKIATAMNTLMNKKVNFLLHDEDDIKKYFGSMKNFAYNLYNDRIQEMLNAHSFRCCYIDPTILNDVSSFFQINTMEAQFNITNIQIIGNEVYAYIETIDGKPITEDSRFEQIKFVPRVIKLKHAGCAVNLIAYDYKNNEDSLSKIIEESKEV